MNINKEIDDEDKYLYKSDNGKFDIDKFNQNFLQYKQKRKKEMTHKMADKLKKINKPKNIIPIYDKSIGQIIIDTKDSIFEIIDDLLLLKVNLNTFTRNNRLFYIGIIFIFISFLIFIYNSIISEEYDNNNNNNAILIQHLHQVLHQIKN
jgi:hypothetical protein